MSIRQFALPNLTNLTNCKTKDISSVVVTNFNSQNIFPFLCCQFSANLISQVHLLVVSVLLFCLLCNKSKSNVDFSTPHKLQTVPPCRYLRLLHVFCVFRKLSSVMSSYIVYECVLSLHVKLPYSKRQMTIQSLFSTHSFSLSVFDLFHSCDTIHREAGELFMSCG